MANFPVINGREYSFSTVRIKLLGKDYFSVKSINYKTAKTKGRPMGNGQAVLGKTKGNRENSGDIEMLRREFEQMKKDIKASRFYVRGAGFGDVDFDIEVTYRETGMDTLVDELIAVNIDEADLSNSQGTDASTVKLTLFPLKIKINGDEI